MPNKADTVTMDAVYTAPGYLFRRMQQIAREAYASTESNIYVVSPEMSHVSKEFAAENPGFWQQRAGPESSKPAINKPATKDPKAKER